MKKINIIALSLAFAFTLTSFLANAQTVTLRYESGFCNKVKAEVFGGPTVKVYDTDYFKFCSFDNSVHRIADLDSEVDIYTFQLQRLINGSFIDQGSGHSKDETNTVYRDLQYNSTYRVRVTIRPGNGVNVWSPYFECNAIIGQSPASEITLFTNPLEIEPYNGLTDGDLSGILIGGSGGDGLSMSNPRIYCQADVSSSDIFYNVSGTFGPDHWQVNLSRLDMTGGWAGGDWHDYETAASVGTLGIFGEGWKGKYGSNSIWPGLYRVSINAHQDCDNASWAYHEDYFRILPSGQCRIDVANIEPTINLFPNPAKDFLRYDILAIENAETQLNFSIYSLNGQLVKQGALNNPSGRIDISTLENGMYSILFESEEYSTAKKITVLR